MIAQVLKLYIYPNVKTKLETKKNLINILPQRQTKYKENK
jgi:hypothetical protein